MVECPHTHVAFDNVVVSARREVMAFAWRAPIWLDTKYEIRNTKYGASDNPFLSVAECLLV